MNKRIQDRHQRQVTRARERRAKLSEPDVRTPEQIKAAREASRPAGGGRSGPQAPTTNAPPARGEKEKGCCSGPASVFFFFPNNFPFWKFHRIQECRRTK